MNPNQCFHKPNAQVNFRKGDLYQQGPSKNHPKPDPNVYTGVPKDLLPVAPYGDDHANRNWYRRTFGRYPNFAGPQALSFIRAQAEVFRANFGRYPHELAAIALGAAASAAA